MESSTTIKNPNNNNHADSHNLINNQSQQTAALQNNNLTVSAQPFTPAANNGNNANNNNLAVQQSNNAIAPAQSYTPVPAAAAAPLHSVAATSAGHPIYNQAMHSPNMFVPAPGVHQAGPMYATMMPTQIPSNVYVNNVTANVNLHGWPHAVPTYIPAGAPHYIQGDVPPDQNPSVMQAIPGVPVALAPSNAIIAAGGNGNPSAQMGNLSSRGSRRGRGRGGSGGSRRGDYNNQRHPPPEGSPAPQPQMVQTQEQMGQPQSLTQQQQSQQIDASNQLMAAGPPSYAAQPQYAHTPTYAAYPYQTYFAAQNPMLHPGQAAQQAAGTPLYVSHMPMYNPVYNYMGGPFVYPPVMNPPEYQFLPGEDGQCDERQNPEAMVAPMWHAQSIYADEYGMNPEMHNAGEEINHNAASMGSVDTPSMLSPNYAMYDPQIHEVQQHMGMMHIYEESQIAPMPGMHPEVAVTQLEEEIVECAAQPGTIQMVTSGTMISAGPIQMSNETQIIHHSHSQHQSQHIIQNTVLEMKTHHSSESENINVENSSADEVSELQTVGSISSLNEMHTHHSHQSTENIVTDEYQVQQQQQQLSLPQQQHQITQSPPKQQQVQHVSAHFQPQTVVDMPVAIPTNEVYHNPHDNVPKEEPTEVPVATVAPAAAASVAVAAQPTPVQQQVPTVAAVVSAQPAATAVASVSTATNVPTQQQQIQTSPPLQKYHHQQQQSQQQQQHQQMHPKHQQQSYNRYDQQQQQHHNQQYHHQQNHNYQYEQRRPQQNYNNNQSRRKYDYNNPTYAPNNNNNNNNNNGNNNNDSAIQTTKTMSWTNSSKKSTASVAVTAIPSNNNSNNNNNNQNRSYSHSSRTYTNHQHHYQQQSHYHQHNQQQQQQHGGHYNQTPQMRNHGSMKVPSSPVGGNAPPQFGNNNASERRNSQAEQLKYANNANNSAYNNYNQYANNSGNSTSSSSNANNAGASAATSTASTTAAPQHFPQQQQHHQQHAQATQQQQQQQQQTAAQLSQNQSPQQQQQALVIDSKQYPGFTSTKKAAAAAAAAATATAAASTAPIMNLAPPVTANTNTTTPSTQSWASLFNDTNNANTTAASASGAQSGNSSSNNNSNTNANTQSSNSSPALPPPFSSKKPIAKVAPYECVVPAPVNLAPPVVLPGAMSYSAASAQGIPPQTPPSVTKALVKPEPPAATSRANLDEYTLKFADYLTKAKTDLSTVSLRPRGLTNPSNYCYINSILQALLGCAPFYNLIRSIPKQAAALSEVRTPTVNALISFVAQFSTLPTGMRLRTNKGPKSKDELGSELQCDSAFEPSDIYRLWVDSREEYVEGRQEDAEEFLSYVLNKLNDEMLEVIKLVAKPNAEQNGRNEVSESEDGDEWQMICNNRNKGSVTRQQDFGRTPLSDIFRGELRSRLQREGEHSTDAIQPFFTLQLNIEKAASVKEALEILVGRDQLEGVTGSKTKQEVVAWQQMTLEKLPTILILHLKWFDYRSDGCTKILKKVEFPVDLKIDAKILASKKYSMKQRAYRLFAVVYHDGKEATKGHYITDVYHTGYSSWLRYNDSSVKPVSENEVLYPKTPRVPYLLYYRRCDTMPQQNNNNASTGGNANANHGGRDRDGNK